MTAAVALEQASSLCVRCGYDLRGVADAQPCPECGLLAIRSRRPTEQLRDAAPRWLGKLSVGVWLMLLAVVSPCVFFPLLIFAVSIGGGSGWNYVGRALPAMAFGLGALCFAAGAWLVTTDEFQGRCRLWSRVIRLLSLFPFVACAVTAMRLFYWPWGLAGTYSQMAWESQLRWTNALEWISFLAAPVFVVPLPLLLFLRLGGLAKRLLSRRLNEHSVIMGVGLSATLLGAVIVTLLFDYYRQLGLSENWETRSPMSLILVVTVMSASILFWLWSFYVLVLFARAFWRERLAMKRAWQAADMSDSTRARQGVS